MDGLAAPDLICSAVSNIFTFVTTSDGIKLLSRILASPIRELIKAVFSNPSYSTNIRVSFAEPNNLTERVYLLWKNMCTCFGNCYNKAFSSELLAVLAPMLVSRWMEYCFVYMYMSVHCISVNVIINHATRA